MQFFIDAGVVGWTIIATGLVTFGLIAERSYQLFFKYKINSNLLWNKIESAVNLNQGEEALVMLAQMEAHPMAAALKNIIEKADRDDQSIFQAYDISMSEQIPKFGHRVQYLSMLANVATLLGLLGTIHGLILSFKAVAAADAASKQVLLANGISVSMYTTALGLAVAIPAMVAFSILINRQNILAEETIEKCNKLTELLTSSRFFKQKSLLQSAQQLDKLSTQNSERAS